MHYLWVAIFGVVQFWDFGVSSTAQGHIRANHTHSKYFCTRSKHKSLKLTTRQKVKNEVQVGVVGGRGNSNLVFYPQSAIAVISRLGGGGGTIQSTANGEAFCLVGFTFTPAIFRLTTMQCGLLRHSNVVVSIVVASVCACVCVCVCVYVGGGGGG